MKILETQSAVLTNVEVLVHLKDVQARHASHPDYDRKEPAKLRNLHVAVTDAITYLTTTPTVPPTAAAPAKTPPVEQLVPALMQRLARYPTLTKGEKLMILNIRPADRDALEVLVEEAESRLSAEEMDEIVKVVEECFAGKSE